MCCLGEKYGQNSILRYKIYKSERLLLSLNTEINQDLAISKDEKREVACPICLSLASWSFSRTILNIHFANLYICPSCDYLFAENPHWLKDAYHRVINTMDTGCMARLIHLRDETALPIYLMPGDRGSWIDYGGGHGGYCRLMRDVGFDFYWNDPMAENLFAAGFEEPSGIKFAGVTCFECFEHFTDPREEMKKMLARGPRIIFSTELRPRRVPDQDNWPYYGWEHGQHVGFHTQKSLRALGEIFGLQLVSDGSFLHAFIPETEADTVAARLIHHRRLPLTAWIHSRMRKLFRTNIFWESLCKGKIVSKDFVTSLEKVLGSKTWTDHLRMKEAAKKRLM